MLRLVVADRPSLNFAVCEATTAENRHDPRDPHEIHEIVRDRSYCCGRTRS